MVILLISLFRNQLLDNVNIAATQFCNYKIKNKTYKYLNSNLHVILLQYQTTFFNVIYFIFGCAWSSLLCGLFFNKQAGAPFLVTACEFLTVVSAHCGQLDSGTRGLQQVQLWGSRAQIQLLRRMGLATLRRVESFRPGMEPMSPELDSLSKPPGSLNYS